MTIIVGLVTADGLYMGSDSAVSYGDEVRSLAQPKLFMVDEYLVGVAGSWRVSQVVRYHLDLDTTGVARDEDEFMVIEFVDKLREALKANGVSKADNGEESHSSDMLVGYRGGLYEIGSDFSVIRLNESFTAIGSGREYALGALAVLEGRPPEERLRRAMTTAAIYDPFIRGPFQIRHRVGLRPLTTGDALG